MKFFLISVFILLSVQASAKEKPTTAIPPAQSTVKNTNQQQTQQQQQNFAPEDRPPSNNLGEQAQVVYPAPEQINRDVLQDVERLQLTPEQMNRLKELQLEKERAAASPYVNPPTPVTRSLFVNLNAGISPPVVRLARGQFTSVVFSDMSGQPWYIESISVNCELFSTPLCIKGDKADKSSETKTNVLSIEPQTPVAYGNVTVVLKGLSTPVIFILTSGQKEVDMRLDAKIPGRNPDSASQISTNGMPTIDNSLANFLDGVPPSSAKKLKVHGDGVEAWAYRDHLYVRANADALYPAFTASARSTTGMSVYKFDEIYSSVTFTSGGQALTAYIEQ